MLRMDSYSLCPLPGQPPLACLLEMDTAPLTPTLPSPTTPSSPTAFFLSDQDLLGAGTSSPQQQAAAAPPAGWQQALPFASALALKAEPSCELMMDLTRAGLIPPAESGLPLQAVVPASAPASAGWEVAAAAAAPGPSQATTMEPLPLLLPPPPPAIRTSADPSAVLTPHCSPLPRTLPAARPPPAHSAMFASLALPAVPRSYPENPSAGSLLPGGWGLGPLVASPRLTVSPLVVEQPGQTVVTTGLPPSVASPELPSPAAAQGLQARVSTGPTQAPYTSAASSQVSSQLPAGGVPRVGSTANVQQQPPAPEGTAAGVWPHSGSGAMEEGPGEDQEMAPSDELPVSVKSLPHASFLTPPSKRRGKGGRQPAPDPCLDPNMDPKRARRIMANRLSAAKSKMKQKKQEQTLQQQLDAATQQRSALNSELLNLKTMCAKEEQEHLALQQQIQELEGGQ